MSPAPQPGAAPGTAPQAVAQHHRQPPTNSQTGPSSHPNAPNGAKETGRSAAQMISASPATTDPAVSGQTAAPPRPVVKMKRTGHQVPFPVSSSSLGSGVAAKSSLQNPTKAEVASHSPSLPPAIRDPPPSQARPSHVDSVATSLSSPHFPSSSLSPPPDRAPRDSSSSLARPHRQMDRPRRRLPRSWRQTSPNSSREPSPDKSNKPKPAQQPLHTPANATPRGTAAYSEQALAASPHGPTPATPAINPRTNQVYSSADAVDDGDYRHYLQTDDPLETDSNTRGALIPQGYKKSNDAEYPWICPLRSCRSKHALLGGLGTHFISAHRGRCFNDNLDGTLTDLGEYRADGYNSSKPAIIVSKTPMTLHESPIAPAWRREKGRPVAVPPASGRKSKVSVGYSDASSPFGAASSSSDSEPIMEKRTIFKMANPDRAYNQWIDPDTGVKQSLSKALLPDDYTMQSSIPDRPFICPIRSCRHLHKNIADLSIHWERAHLGRYLNDNLDGTFTIIGDRKKQHKPAVVVSKTPNDSDPIAVPKYPRYTTGKNTVWVDLHDEDTVIDHNTGVSDINSGSRIARDVPQRRIKEPRPAPPPPPQIGIKEAQGRVEDSIQVSASTSPVRDTIHSDVGIVNTKSGRPYASWVDPDTGAVKPMNSGAIPDGYKLLSDEHPTRPFVCPIRTCRRLCKNFHGLGGHFGNMHAKDLLNDNGDATLSIVGQGKSCMVVSQNPLDPDEPMVDPTFPEYSKPFYDRELANHQPGSSSARPTLVDNSVLEADDEFDDDDVPGSVPEPPSAKPPVTKDVVRSTEGTDPQGSWSFLCSELGKEYPLATTGCADLLLQLAPVRSLDLRRPLKKGLDSRELDSTLIQLVGEEYPKAACTQCRRGNGPFNGCVRAPADIADQLQPYLRSQTRACANCLFTKLAHTCSIKSSGRYTTSTWSRPIARETAAPKPSHPGAHPLDEEIPGTSSSDEDDAETRNLLKRRRSARASRVAEEPEPKRSRVVTMRVQPDKLGATTSTPSTTPGFRVPTAQAPVSVAATFGVSPATTQDVLEMEDWEMEEGQIPAADPSTHGQNLATHISIGQTVQLFKDVTLSTQVISSTAAFSFPPDSNKTRVCVMIGGKLRVQVGDEKEFVVGQHGMFRINPGVKCLVVNTAYIDALLQVTTKTGSGGQ